jgi:hypothetical protein
LRPPGDRTRSPFSGEARSGHTRGSHRDHPLFAGAWKKSIAKAAQQEETRSQSQFAEFGEGNAVNKHLAQQLFW